MIESPTQNLTKLVRQKRRLLEQLFAVGRRQGELIDGGDVPSLLKLLSAKQQLITALRSTEQQLRPFQQEDPDARPWPSPDDRAACAADAEACNRLLGEVLKLEKNHEQLMVRRRDDVSKQLRTAQSAHNASTAYQPHVRRHSSPPSGEQPNPTLSATLDLTSGE